MKNISHLFIAIPFFLMACQGVPKYRQNTDEPAPQNNRAATTTKPNNEEFKPPKSQSEHEKQLKAGTIDDTQCVNTSGKIFEEDDSGYETCVNEVNSSIQKEQIKNSIMNSREKKSQKKSEPKAPSTRSKDF